MSTASHNECMAHHGDNRSCADHWPHGQCYGEGHWPHGQCYGEGASRALGRRPFLKGLFTGIAGLTLGGLRPLTAATPMTPPVRLGIDVLEQSGFIHLRNKRVGLLTHPAGVNRLGVSTIEVLRRSPIVNLVALFGPEHGIYGDEKANVPVDDKIDQRTGLPVFSLYGRFRRPTSEIGRAHV